MLVTSRAIRVVASGRVALVARISEARRFSDGLIDCKPPFVPEKYVDLNNQSFLIPGPERCRATMLTRDPYKLVHEIPGSPQVKTVFDTICHGFEVSGDGPCAGAKNKETNQYEWVSYSQVIERSKQVGSAFVELGLKPRSEHYVGVFAANRTEFVVSLYGCAGYSIVLIPLYDALGVDNVNFIIAQAEMRVVIANNNANALNVLRSREKMPFLQTVVMMDAPSPEVAERAEAAKIRLMTFDELQNLGRAAKRDLIMPEPDDIFCIPYTSGTTGPPKGVMISHRNVMACLSGLVYAYGTACRFGGTIASYLPAAHMYEIVNEVGSLYFARRLAFLTPDITRFFDDIRLIKPNILPLVPRLMNAFYSKVMDELKSSRVKSQIFHYALSRKEKLLRKGIVTNRSIWDKLVFKKIQDVLGGNMQMLITTSAPISPEVIRFFRCAAGCHVFEIYGQTEVLASTMTLPHEVEGGSVGPPLPCNFVKLADVPEMNYFAENDEGEICYKGPNVFKGYFKSPELTKECLDEDGWQHSGDIGRWLPNGVLQVIDRKKHLFKLSQGEYIAPERVENVYLQSDIVAQIFVDGFPTESYSVAIVIPQKEALLVWAKSKGFTDPFEKMIQNKELRTGVLRELHKFGKKADLNALEQVRNIIFSEEAFTVDNGMLSPTLKLKRNLARKQYHHIMQSMYEEGPLIKSISR